MLLNLMVAGALAVQAVAPAPSINPQSCDDPAARKAMLAAGVDGFTVFGDLKRHSDANKVRTDALLDRLSVRGQLSREQRGSVSLKMIEDPAFKIAQKEGSVLLEQMVAQLGHMTEGDTAANCRIILGLADTMPAIQAVTERQWQAMRAVIEAEAQRLGVSLAD